MYKVINAYNGETIKEFDSLEEARDYIYDTKYVIEFSPEAILKFNADCCDLQEQF